MKHLRSICLTLLPLAVMTASPAAPAQQSGTQPVLSATPVTSMPSAAPVGAPAPQAPAGIGVQTPPGAVGSSAGSPVGSSPGSAVQAPSASGVVGTTVLPPAVGAPNIPAGYIIGPEDSIQITVWKEPGLSGTLPVRPDGMISLPLIGDLPAAGVAPMQLSMDITARMKKFITDPNVTVTVLAVNSKRIFLLGEVQHIGAMPLMPGMTPLQAIASAGGLTAFANPKRIYILRGEQGKQQKIHYDYKKALKEGNEQGVTLVSGDTIVVP